MAAALDVSERTVFRAKRRYVEEGLEEVLRHHNSPNPYRKVDDRVEAHLVALVCSPAPEGPGLSHLEISRLSFGISGDGQRYFRL